MSPREHAAHRSPVTSVVTVRLRFWRSLGRVARLAPSLALVVSMGAAATQHLGDVVPPVTGEQASPSGRDWSAFDPPSPDPLMGGRVVGESGLAAMSAPLTGEAAGRVSSLSGMPEPAHRAYRAAAQRVAGEDPGCHLPWSVLAGIGRVESNHGRHAGSALTADARAVPPIIGIRLDGRMPGTARIGDSDGGRWDGDTSFDRAVGPMQFIPGTWSRYGADGDGDGRRDPQDLDDAALAAARYLCAGDVNMSTVAGRRAAVYRYNHDANYVSLVLSYADGYAAGRLSLVAAGAPGGSSGGGAVMAGGGSSSGGSSVGRTGTLPVRTTSSRLTTTTSRTAPPTTRRPVPTSTGGSRPTSTRSIPPETSAPPETTIPSTSSPTDVPTPTTPTCTPEPSPVASGSDTPTPSPTSEGPEVSPGAVDPCATPSPSSEGSGVAAPSMTSTGAVGVASAESAVEPTVTALGLPGGGRPGMV